MNESQPLDPQAGRPHVVVLGAGFGGLRAAQAFNDRPVRVTLVDQNNYHLFQPLLYQVATSMLSPDAIAYPVRTTLHNQRNLHFWLGRVERVDLAARRVFTSQGSLDYDYLIVALGGQTNFFNIPSVEQRAFGLKDLADATRLRNHILRQFECAATEPDPAMRRALLTFVIVGGGPTGVELAGSISELIRLVLRKDYPELDFNEVQVILLEAIDRLLAAMPEELGARTAEVLRRKHIDLRFNTTVASYDGRQVRLKEGDAIPAGTLVWAAGVRAASVLDTLGVEQDRSGRVMVAETLQVPGHPEVLVIGDAAHCPDEDGRPLPMLAPVAMQQAEWAAKNVLNAAAGREPEVFRYRDPGVMATIGRNQAVAHIGRLKLSGFIAWMMWLAVHVFQLIGFRNRVAVLIDWGWSYIFYQRVVRLIGPG